MSSAKATSEFYFAIKQKKVYVFIGSIAHVLDYFHFLSLLLIRASVLQIIAHSLLSNASFIKKKEVQRLLVFIQLSATYIPTSLLK